MKGFEVWNKIQELPARAMNKLLKTMVNGPVKEAVEKVSELFRTFCKSTAQVATSGLTTGLVGLALIGGGINVEAKGGTCTITGNRARGIQAANKMIAKIKANNPNWEYIGTEFPVVDGTNKRVFDAVFLDENNKFIIFESKNGYASFSGNNKKQVYKDGELLSLDVLPELNGQPIHQYYWVFSKSEVTGKLGPSNPMRAELEAEE